MTQRLFTFRNNATAGKATRVMLDHAIVTKHPNLARGLLPLARAAGMRNRANVLENNVVDTKRFVHAMVTGDLAELRSILRRVGKLKARHLVTMKVSVTDKSALNYFLYSGHEKGAYECVKALVEAGADVNPKGEPNPIIAAIKYGKRPSEIYSIVTYLVNNGARVAGPGDANPLTVLFNNIFHVRDPYIARLIIFLLQRGADPNAPFLACLYMVSTDVDAYTIQFLRPIIFAFLASKKLNVNTNDTYNQTPLLHAVFLPSTLAYEVCVKLLDKGANVNAITTNGSTPISQATGCRGVMKYKLPHIKVVELLLRHGANPNTRYDDRSILQDAVFEPDRDVRAALMTLLLRYKAKINDTMNSNTAGKVSTFVAFMQRAPDPATVEWFLRAGADPNELHGAPLNLAVRATGITEFERYRIVDSLLKHGADPNIAPKTTGGHTPLKIAIEKRAQNIVTLLLKQKTTRLDGAIYVSFSSASVPIFLGYLYYNPTRENVELMLRLGADPNTPTQKGMTPLRIVMTSMETPYTHMKISKEVGYSILETLLKYGARYDRSFTIKDPVIKQMVGRVQGKTSFQQLPARKRPRNAHNTTKNNKRPRK